jgi:hypothetical protein
MTLASPFPKDVTIGATDYKMQRVCDKTNALDLHMESQGHRGPRDPTRV